jgi:septal ring factor EnvC (AmiA/AmiB activator)
MKFLERKSKSVGDQNVASNYQLVELRVTLQSILHRLNDVESSEKQNVKIIDGLRKENEKLKFELSKIKGYLEHYIEISDRKSTQTEAKLKLITQQTKSICEFDFNVYNENI